MPLVGGGFKNAYLTKTAQKSAIVRVTAAGGAVGLGYVTAADSAPVGAVEPDDYEIEVAGIRYPATASLRPLYDPKNERIKC